MSMWYIIIAIVMADGRVVADVRYPLKPEYNNEQTCNEVGQFLMTEEQKKIGTKNGQVYYICKELTKEQYRAATVKGQDI